MKKLYRTFSSLALLVAAISLDEMVSIGTISSTSDVITMNTEVASVFVQCLQRRHIRCIFNHLINPFDT